MFVSKISLNALSILFLVSGILLEIVDAAVDVDVGVDPNNVGAAPIRSNLRGLLSSEEKTYIISFTDKDVSPEKRCMAIAKANGGTVGYIYSNVLNGCSITIPVGQMQAQSIFMALNNRPEVKLVNEDKMMYISRSEVESKEFDSSFTSQAVSVTAKSWGLDRVDQCSLPLNSLATKQSASGVRVFILDTGVRSTHQDFSGMINSANACHFTVYSNAMVDQHGHGTHVAGTACGVNYGVASDCILCPVQVMSSKGTGPTSGIISGINFVVGKCKGASFRCVINMSLGGSLDSSLNTAVSNAVDNGVVVVVAAGNDGQDACSYSPSSAAKAITVGSTTSSDAKSSFSNTGSCVDVYAPGTNIVSASKSSDTGITTMSGTSMASPHVAGMAAAILSKNPLLTPSQVRDAIVNKSKRYTPSSGLVWYLATECSTSTVPTSAPTSASTQKPSTARPTTPRPTGVPTASPSESIFPTSSSNPTNCVCECPTIN